MYEKGPQEYSDFDIRKKEARHVIYDMYGHNNDKADTMLKKLDECKTESQITRVLAWGRVNLL